MNRVFEASVNFCKYVLGTVFECEVEGEMNMPRSGGCLLASNHESFIDPPLVGSHAIRPVHYFARKTLFKPGIKGRILKKIGAIPVDRDGDSDIGAFKTVLSLLKSGEVVGIFPEGTRTPDGRLQTAKRGVGMMACKAGVPVLPARVYGPFRAWGKGRKLNFRVPLKVVYGPPLYPEDYDPGKENKDRYQIAADRIMQAIASLGENPFME